MITLSFSPAEIDTLIAALEQWIDSRGVVGPEMLDIETNGGEHPPLSDEEIDLLIERINVSEKERHGAQGDKADPSGSEPA